jgi:hypothetical protein
MKLYVVYNGYQNDFPICILVIAGSAERAIELAKPEFINKYGKDGEEHYSNLSTEKLFDQLDHENSTWINE